ncbi:hypothetical protein [Streptomyces sp. NPDC047009]|uniref:hypothetical protein n=1 Tax=Streptomyces sp. NPDC047009 TaxID=3154496 RepID=UPI0033E8A8B8
MIRLSREAFDPQDTAVTVKANTEDALAAALDTAKNNRDRLVFVEAFMERLDAPESLVKLGKTFATADYRTRPSPDRGPAAAVSVRLPQDPLGAVGAPRLGRPMTAASTRCSSGAVRRTVARTR